MNLQQLQTNLCSLIKSRPGTNAGNDDYLNKVNASPNLLLVKKIGLWWRKIQVENYCILTVKFLKLTGQFDSQLTNFFNEQKYSAFREEVSVQFLEYIISKNIDSLTTSVAEFELALIKLKLGENIESLIKWEYEPYGVINGLLRNTLCLKKQAKEEYQVEISYKNRDELFTVKNSMLPVNN